MNCLSKEEFTDYLFGADRAIDRAAMEKHFSVCAGCRARMETMKQLKAAVASVAPEPVSGDFTAKLMRKLKEQAASPASTDVPALFTRLFRPAWGLGLAAFAVAIYAGAVFLTGRLAPRSAPVEVLYFSDGPATVNNSFFAAEVRVAAADTPGKPETGYVYTDTCAAVKCGVL